MKYLFLFLKGLLIGIGKVIPGVSGSMIAIVLHVYEEAIYAINHFFQDWKRYFLFLGSLGIGIFVATILFSNVILFFYHHYYLWTMFLFLGLILGTVPSLQKNISFQGLKLKFFFLLFFLLPFGISFFSFSEFHMTNSIFSFLILFFLGVLEALTMIVPGISGTAIYMMLGVYSFILDLFGNPFANLFWTISFGSGLFVGVIVVSNFVEYLFGFHRKLFEVSILGLLWSSILYLFLSVVSYLNFGNVFGVLLLFVFGFGISYVMSKQ
ncbi:MAG: DUF368 domain-containing protein [Bacilli bacterium]|nr:DUF368 domain-containing protein [Bacilli bacterium]